MAHLQWLEPLGNHVGDMINRMLGVLAMEHTVATAGCLRGEQDEHENNQCNMRIFNMVYVEDNAMHRWRAYVIESTKESERSSVIGTQKFILAQQIAGMSLHEWGRVL